MAASALSRAVEHVTRGIAAWRGFVSRHYYAAVLGGVCHPFQIDLGVEVRNPDSIHLGANCIIKRGTILNGRSEKRDFGLVFGDDTYVKEYCYLDSYGGFIDIAGPCAISQFCVFHGGGGISIGRYVMFGAHCSVISSNHVYKDLELPYMLQGDRSVGITIEDNVWVGAAAIILDGVTIGRNSIVGAGAIVTRNVPPNSLYADRCPRVIEGALHRKEMRP